MVFSDIVLTRPLPEALAKDVLAWVGCVTGAGQRTTYFTRLEAAGLTGVEVLRDIDYAVGLAEASPPEAAALLDPLGPSLDDGEQPRPQHWPSSRGR